MSSGIKYGLDKFNNVLKKVMCDGVYKVLCFNLCVIGHAKRTVHFMTLMWIAINKITLM